MKSSINCILGLGVLFLSTGWGLVGCSAAKASAGPYGGDLVTIENGAAQAELVANSETGEVMVHTWDKDLKSPHPIESIPLMIGSGDRSVELAPHPAPSDPPGRCSRFFGHADWMRGGGFHEGWMSMGGSGNLRQNFSWTRCWEGGRKHGAMWSEMGEHRRMGMNSAEGQHH